MRQSTHFLTALLGCWITFSTSAEAETLNEPRRPPSLPEPCRAPTATKFRLWRKREERRFRHRAVTVTTSCRSSRDRATSRAGETSSWRKAACVLHVLSLKPLSQS